MRLKIVILLCSVGTLAAGPSFSQQKKLDVSYSNVSLMAVLDDLTARTGYQILVHKEIVPETATITMSKKNATVEEILNDILPGNGLTYTIKDEVIVISPSSAKQQPARQAAPVTATGMVRDADGKPIAGAAVVLKSNTSIGTATDAAGKFSLRLPNPEGAVLVVSFLGKKSVEIAYTGQKDIQVKLEDDTAAIDGVVVTGIFNKAKESYTGAVTTITDRELEAYRGQNLIQTLRNIDPAINVLSNNLDGSNPNILPDITLRGSSSLPVNVQEFNENVKYDINTPLIIMDGFEITLQKLMDYNDEEIESINILKDASATAIYGSRGANGVIVIVSKQPVAGNLRINARAGIEFEIPDLTSYDMLDARRKLQLEWDNGFYDNLNPNQDRGLKRRYYSLLRDVQGGTDTYWLSKPLRTGVTQRYNVRLEGGSEEFRWGVSTSYSNIEGAMKGSSRENFTGEIILSYHYRNVILRNQTNIGLNNGVNSKYGNYRDYVNMNPYWRVTDEEGNYVQSYRAVTGSSMGSLQTVYNPLYNASLKSFDESAYTDIINNFSIEWNIITGLILRGQLGLSQQHNTSDRFTSPKHTKYLESPYNSGDGLLRRGEYVYRSGKDRNYDASVTLSYAKVFNERHQLYAGFDWSLAQKKGNKYTFIGEGFTNEKLNSVGSAQRYAQNGKPEEYENYTRRVGFTGNVNYTYDNRYYADGSLRMDGSSQFGSDKRFAPFWSVGIGWNIHREKFMAGTGWLNNFRLRLSYGQTGSQQFSPYQALSTYAYYMDDSYGTWGGAYLKSHGNKDLKWQVTDQFNAGLELGIFNNRMTMAFDYYIKKTSNLLSELEIPYATGFGSYIENIGEVKNNGFELALGGYLIRDTERRIIWTLNAKLAYNRNEITKVSEAIEEQNQQYLLEDVDVSTLFYEGRSQNSIYAIRSLGIDPSTGKEVFLDRNGNITDTWRPSDKVYMGVGEPAYRGNISTMFRWRDLSLNLSFGCHWGGKAYNQTLVDRVEMLRSEIGVNNVDSRVLSKRWQAPGDEAEFRKIAAMGETDTKTRASSRFVMKDNVFELQSASIQYRRESEWLKKIGVSSATFGVNASDLFHISSIRRERGINYPFARRVGVSVTLMF